MKKLVLTPLILCTFVLSSYSQVKVGIRGGLNLSRFVGDNSTGDKSVFGPHVGGFLRINSDANLYFQPELLFSMKGDAVEKDILGSTYESSIRLSYIDVPLMGVFKPVKNFGILLGLQPSILIGAKSKVEFNGKKSTEKGTDGLNTFDLAGVAGLQYEPGSGVDIGLRVNYGFPNVIKDSDGNHNLTFMLTVGYAFGD